MLHQAPTSGAISFAQLLAGFLPLTELQREELKGRCNQVPVKERSEFQRLYLAQFQTMVRVAQLRESATDGGIKWPADNPGKTIVGLSGLTNLHQTGERLDETTGRVVKHTLRELFENSSLMSNYGIIIMGAGGTTGFGKTQLALALAIHWTLAIAKANGKQPSEATVVTTNTIDIGNKVKFKSGWCWVIDEYLPADTTSQVYGSANILKVFTTKLIN